MNEDKEGGFLGGTHPPIEPQVRLALPNDPAGQQATAYQQDTGTKRYSAGNRNATRARERRRRTAATASRIHRSGIHRNSSGVDVDVTTGSHALEAGEHLVLADTQLLGYRAEVIRRGILVLPDGSLDLVAVHVLDATSDGRLGEGRGGSSQHHSQHRRQQHYLPQLHYLLVNAFRYTPWKTVSFFCALYVHLLFSARPTPLLCLPTSAIVRDAASNSLTVS